MSLSLTQLRVVRAIAQEGSAGAAARRLRLSQPAVSRSLAESEKRLGVELFVRTGRGMELTESGRRVVRAAARVDDELRRLRFDLERLHSDRSGRLRVATQCYTYYEWFPQVLVRFRQEFPGFEVTIVPEATRDPLRALRRGEIDVALAHSAIDLEAFQRQSLFRDELLAVVSPDHPLAAGASVQPEELRDQTLLLHFDPPGSLVMREFLTPHGVEPAHIDCLQLTEAVLASCRAGFGVAILPAWIVADDLAAGRLVGRSLGEGLHRDWSLAVRRDDAERPALAAFLRLARREAARRLTQLGSTASHGPG